MSRTPQPYADPYFAGVGLGLVLLGAFVIVGRGLGASGAFASTASAVATVVAPAQAAKSPYFARYRADGVPPWRDWLVVELLGVAIGGGLSAWLAGRMRRTVERGPRISRGGPPRVRPGRRRHDGPRRRAGARLHERAGPDGRRALEPG